MPTVTFLTAAKLPIADDETPLIATALQAFDIESRIVAWTDSAALATPSDLVMIRSTWDYSPVVNIFVQALRDIPSTLANPVDIVAWNSHKGYLVELAAAGVPVVPTTLVRSGDKFAVDGTVPLIIKPAVSVGAIGVGRFDADDAAAGSHLESLLETGDVLVQPFQPEVAQGERSLIFIGGRYSHAVRKVPAPGDFRVHQHLGGSLHPHEPSSAELAVADAALAAVNADLLYARVDLIVGPNGPQLMELELIEPFLFLIDAPGSAERLAAAIAARIR